MTRSLRWALVLYVFTDTERPIGAGPTSESRASISLLILVDEEFTLHPERP
jgi:hypothetical protein